MVTYGLRKCKELSLKGIRNECRKYVFMLFFFSTGVEKFFLDIHIVLKFVLCLCTESGNLLYDN